MIELSIIIPAYNEEKRLPQTLEEIQSYLEKRPTPLNYEILVVDDGSTDQTAALAKKAHEKEPRIALVQLEGNRGKGYTVKKGFQKAQGQAVLFSDADLSTPIEELEKMLPELERFDVVIASRSLEDSDVQIKQGPMRAIMGIVFGFLMRSLLLPGIRDSQCGFKLFSRKAVDQLLQQELNVDGFAFDVEWLYVVRRLGFQIKEIPVRWLNAEGTKVNPILDPIRMFVQLFLIRMHHRKLKATQTNKI